LLNQLRLLARRYLTRETRRRLARSAVLPPVGWVRFGSLRRLKPISSDYGNSRGLEIDRYYIEKFIFEHAQDIHGHVLEIKHNTYTLKYGGDRVTKSDVLHKVTGNPDATIVADLSNADQLPSNTFDTILITQTLQFIYDVKPAIATLYRILKPKGTLLVTTPGISPIIREDYEQWGEYWRFTALSARLLFEEAFPKENIFVRSYGNVLAAISFLEGLAVEDLQEKELDAVDPNYELIIGIQATKAGSSE
jgi:SAM-dependent methyltransferase